eukprot:117132-Chlamydomonas_euryale.AAC.6
MRAVSDRRPLNACVSGAIAAGLGSLELPQRATQVLPEDRSRGATARPLPPGVDYEHITMHLCHTPRACMHACMHARERTYVRACRL